MTKAIGTLMRHFEGGRRLMSRGDVLAYLNIRSSTLHRWIAEGRIPGPLRGTTKWDRVALDLALDRASGIAEVRPTESEWTRALADADQSPAR